MNRSRIDFESELNPDQFLAVTSPIDRPALVLAGAGSGKTRTLTFRVAWLISELGLSPREILLLTFTNKAARQMLERIKVLTGYEPYDFWGGTFHSIGNRFLRIEGEKIGLKRDFEILDADDSEHLLKNVVNAEYPKFFSNKDNPKASLLYNIISYARNTSLSVNTAMAYRFSWIETPASQIADIANAYDFEKRNRNYCDFDDLLVLWHKLLKECPEVLQKYSDRFSNILVDEYQDTNQIQSDILDLLANKGQLTAVGDDAQCIYSWRGAEIDNILEFRERYPAATIYKIERNYRSTPQILNFANSILAQMPSDEAYRKSLVAARDGRDKPLVIRAMDGVSQGKQVSDCINDIVMSGKYRYEDIAVLYRSHFQAMDVQLQLQYRNIPFAITSGLKFFEQAHVKDVVAQIKFVTNPLDKMSFLRFVKFFPKVGEKTADKILEALNALAKKRDCNAIELLDDKTIISKVPSVSRDIYQVFASDMKALYKSMKSVRRSSEMIAQSITKEEKKGKISKPKQFDFFDSFSEPSSIDTNTEDFSTEKEVATPKDLIKSACVGWYKNAMKTVYEDWEDRVDDLDSLYEYASRYDTLDEFLDNAALEIAEIDGKSQDENRDISRVRLMTVHQAKGLEFPIVFVIGAAEGLFPSKRSVEDGDIEEERRLFYVATTRAMNNLIITYPRVSMQNGNYEMREPSRFLQDIPPDLYDNIYH